MDPLAPEHVTPLVVYLAGPAAAGINGEVFVVHGGVAAVMQPPSIRATFLAADHGSGAGTGDGMWTLESVHRALSSVFPAAAAAGSASPTATALPGGTPDPDGPPPVGFACEDTLALATETIGFPAPGAERATP